KLKFFSLILVQFLRGRYTVILLGVLSSCNKQESIVDTKEKDPKVSVENTLLNRHLNQRSAHGLQLDCITILYPFSLLDSKQNVHEMKNENDLQNLFLKLSQDSSLFILDLLYPVQVEDDKGQKKTANNPEELAEYFAACIPNGGWGSTDFPAYVIDYTNSCFELIYPIEIKDSKAKTKKIDNADELAKAVASDFHSFVFPMKLKKDDGTVVTVNNPEELIDALVSCEGFNCPGNGSWNGSLDNIACYQLIYPVKLLKQDGKIVEVANTDEFNRAILSGDYVGFSYPLNLKNIQDGKNYIANSDAELEALAEACDMIGGPSLDSTVYILMAGLSPDPAAPGCYKVSYPIQLENSQDSAKTINSDLEFFNLIFDPTNEFRRVKYPVTVKMVRTGVEFIIRSSQENFEVLSKC
ncbi:MAG TPA: hypothetical protein PK006_13610, partial [Saprospiraceae bacterium]|nr:hypothetical protein [Saprospiraceae bacterium]